MLGQQKKSGDSQQSRAGHFVAGRAFLLFYVSFFAGLYERLRAAQGSPAIWSRVTWGGASRRRSSKARLRLDLGLAPFIRVTSS
jgi:hypothetical protein